MATMPLPQFTNWDETNQRAEGIDLDSAEHGRIFSVGWVPD